MEQQVWLNLPVEDLARTAAFYKALGYQVKEDRPDMIGVFIGKQEFPIMMVQRERLAEFTQHPVTDLKQSTGVLVSLSAQSKSELDEWTRKVEAAGGTVFAEPADLPGDMRNMAFHDPDGNRFNVLYMPT